MIVQMGYLCCMINETYWTLRNSRQEQKKVKDCGGGDG